MSSTVADSTRKPSGRAATAREDTALAGVEAVETEHTSTAKTAGSVDLLVRVGDQVAVDEELAVAPPGRAS